MSQLDRLMTISLLPVDRAGLVSTRRDIHQHPELGFEETRTATLVADRLRAFDYHVTSGSGKTGAFVLPLLQRIDVSQAVTQALILVPTRELAILNQVRGADSPLRAGTLVKRVVA